MELQTRCRSMCRREVSSGIGRGDRATRKVVDLTCIAIPYLFTRIPMGSLDRLAARVKGVSYGGRRTADGVRRPAGAPGPGPPGLISPSPRGPHRLLVK